MERKGADKGPMVALAPFLSGCPAIITLGLRSTFACYDRRERELLRQAALVFFPTRRYIDLFQAADKRTFPRVTTYHYQGSRLLQYSLFRYLRIPTLRTGIYYGRQKQRALEDFCFPMELFGDRTAGRRQRRVNSRSQWQRFVNEVNPLLVREEVIFEGLLRALVVHDRVVGLQRANPEDRPLRWIPLARLQWPSEPLRQALHLNRSAGLDDIVITWGETQGRWYCIELERPPRRWRTVNGVVHRHELICKMVCEGVLC